MSSNRVAFTHVLFQPLLDFTVSCWPRTITDPELPDDDEKLYFTIINLDMASLSEVRRLTSLEMEGRIDQAGIDAFVKAAAFSSFLSNL